ncbi:MAG: GGDEF domain-containing protein [Gammaproteobacteria bacterium]|nr:GGDEF domain-containing protein [Gammaproteobacteria bacterium]
MANWSKFNELSELIVPLIFFGGGVFVLTVCSLALRTTHDILRIYQLEKDSVTDPLLGIYNRRHIGNTLREHTSVASRYERPLSIFLLDIDHFKNINDTYGHLNGDKVLEQLVDILRRSVRKADIIGRYGGEEFIGVLPNTGAQSAKELVERIRKSVSKQAMVLTGVQGNDAPSVKITVSIGVSTFGPMTMDEDSLINSADEALYQAKNAGRNKTVLHRSCNTITN